MLALNTILAAVDLSESSRAVVAQARGLARACGASLDVLTVVAQPLHEVWTGYVPAPELVDALDHARTEARQRLDHLVSCEDRRGLRIRLATAWGEPADEILAYAKEHQVGLIVCGTHGRRGLDHLLMGSVAERVVRRASCPVLTVRVAQETADVA
jgi:nucleotide-binding universal stress UspA family protein